MQLFQPYDLFRPYRHLGAWTATLDLLFSASEPGAWYDPSDMSTLFQDSAGTTPVTAVEQPVGRMLDKSGRGNHAIQATTTKRPVLSARYNLLTKTEQFDDGVWAKFGISVTTNTQLAPRGDTTGDTLVAAAGSGVVPRITMSVPAAVAGAQHKYSLYVKPGTSNFVQVYKIGDGSVFSNFTLTGAGSATSNGGALGSIVQMAGGWYLITFQYLAAAASQSPALAIIPNASASGTGPWNPVGTESVHVWGASLTLATDAHLPYQWVNTATDYDADPGKFPAYLRFDGVDDALQTGNIDFTGTDKMTVWAGYAKINDGPTSVFLEAGSVYTGGGGIGVFSSDASSANFGFAHSDATGNKVIHLVSAATEIGLITSRYDLQSGAQTSARKNSGAWEIAPASGGGFLGNRPLYIGARAGTSLYFKGRLYSLIVRGAQTQLSQIEAIELYIKQKMRMP